MFENFMLHMDHVNVLGSLNQVAPYCVALLLCKADIGVRQGP